MTKFEESQSLITQLSATERRRLFEWLGHESVEVAPGIFKTPGVCGGNACVRFMRFPVWLIEEAFRNGYSEEQYLRDHPNLTREDIANARAYAAKHSEEIEEAIRLNNIEGFE